MTGRRRAPPPRHRFPAPRCGPTCPQKVAVPEGFDASGGFALRTVVGGNAIDGAVRDTWELLPQGLASYGTDPPGTPVVELATLTGESLWRHEIADPLTHDDRL